MGNDQKSNNTTIIVVVVALLLILPCILGTLVLGGMFFVWSAVELKSTEIDMPMESVEQPTIEPVQPDAQSTLHEKFDPEVLKEK